MLVTLRHWSHWTGKQVHPFRLLLEAVCTCWALWPLAILAYVFAARMFYPIDLEWCEGGALYEAYRMLHGSPVYTRADPSWAPFPYPPAHTAVLALVGLVHLDFWTARLISVAFFGLMCWATFRELYRHLHRSSFGIAVGAFAVATLCCAYPLVGQWYDLGRVDTMMLALALFGISVMSERKASTTRVLVAAVLLTAAVYTKQTGAFFVAWVCLFATVREPLIGLKLSAATFALCMITLGLLEWSTNGGFWFWTIAGLESHKVDDARIVEGLRSIYDFAPLCVLIPVGVLVLGLRRMLSERSILWSGALFVALPASLLPYAKAGGYLNNLMPLAVLVGPVMALLVSDVIRQPGPLDVPARWSLLAALSLFVAAHPLKASDYVPRQQDWQAAKELNAFVASLKGGVVSPYLAFLPAHNGHSNPNWHSMVVWDSIWRGEPMSQVQAFLKSKARWVILNSSDEGDLGRFVRANYKHRRVVPLAARVRMITGAGIVIDEAWEKD